MATKGLESVGRPFFSVVLVVKNIKASFRILQESLESMFYLSGLQNFLVLIQRLFLLLDPRTAAGLDRLISPIKRYSHVNSNGERRRVRPNPKMLLMGTDFQTATETSPKTGEAGVLNRQSGTRTSLEPWKKVTKMDGRRE